jgi:hypothetical protein
MKRLLVVALFPLLPSCALYDAYFMAKYDTNEYALINAVKTKAELAQQTCNDKPATERRVDEIYAQSIEFKNFTQYIPRNQDANNMASKLATLTKDTKDYYNKHDKVSEAFCKMKLQQIVKSSDAIMETLGKKPR